MFLQGLKTSLTIAIDNQTFTVNASRIRNFNIEMHSYGFNAWVEFWFYQRHDKIVSAFAKNQVMEVTFSVSQFFNAPDPAPDPIVLKGFVSGRKMRESFVEVKDKQLEDPYTRYYQIHFEDAAQYVWKQHFPFKLFTNKTLQDVINSEKGEYITLEGQWSELSVAYPMIFLGLMKQFKQPSFYEFMMWYCYLYNGVWNYDANKNSYSIDNSKQNNSEKKKLNVEDVENVHVEFPPVIRYKNRILNATSENPSTQTLEQQYAIAGIEEDVYIRTSIQQDIDALQQQVQDRLIVRQPFLKMIFKRFPTIHFNINQLIEFSTDSGWGKNGFMGQTVYRVFDFSINAQAKNQNPSEEITGEYNSYSVDFSSSLEPQEETYRHFAPFEIPDYDIYVEGNIVSNEGEEDQKTYQVYEDEQTSQKNYKIKIPLFENQQVNAPFIPNLLPGYFYFPEDKDAKVLLSLTVKSAKIYRFLDWRLDAELPQETQGNNILFGLTTKSQTSLNHVYEDNKPVFNISRKQEQDNQNFKMQEGIIVIETLDNPDAE